MAPFILINDKFYPSGEKLFQYTELGRVLFEEKFRAIHNQLAFYTETLELIKLKLKIYNQPEPEIIVHQGAGLKRQIERLLVKNKLFKGALVTLSVFTEDETSGYILSAQTTDTANYELPPKGLLVDVFDKVEKPICGLSGLSIGSSALWQIARNHQGAGIDEYLLLNTHHLIVEAPAKNIYLIKDNQLIFPSPDSGSYMDVSRDVVLRIAKETGLVLSEKPGFTIEQLLSADEIFLANTLEGIQWVVGFREKRYYNMKTKRIGLQLTAMFE